MSKTVVVFHEIDGLPLTLEVWTPVDDGVTTTARKQCPLIFAVHGGGFICGDRSYYPRAQVDYFLSHGCIFVSPNYPLAPQSNVFKQVDAIIAAWDWCHRADDDKTGGTADGLTRRLKEDGNCCAPDPSRTAVFGGSAGASLLVFSLERMEPRPNAAILLYPFVNLLRPSQSVDLSDLGRDRVYPLTEEGRKRQAYLLAKVPFTDVMEGTDFADLFRLADTSDTRDKAAMYASLSDQSAFLLACNEGEDNGLFASAVLGFPVPEDGGDAGGSHSDKGCTSGPEIEDLTTKVPAVDAFHIARETTMPPLVVIQGLNDSVTPADHTKEWVRTILNAKGNGGDATFTCLRGSKEGAPAEAYNPNRPGNANTSETWQDLWLIETEIHGGKHGFDWGLCGSEDPDFVATIGAAFDFVCCHWERQQQAKKQSQLEQPPKAQVVSTATAAAETTTAIGRD